MKSSTSTSEMLTRIAELLATHGEDEWAKSFEVFAYEFDLSPADTKRRIRSVYGGMGSFNDVILHGPYGIPLCDENDELAQLRSELFSSCQN